MKYIDRIESETNQARTHICKYLCHAFLGYEMSPEAAERIANAVAETFRHALLDHFRTEIEEAR